MLHSTIFPKKKFRFENKHQLLRTPWTKLQQPDGFHFEQCYNCLNYWHCEYLWPICGWELDLLMNSSHPPSLLLVLIDWNYFFFTIECGSMWHTLLHILSHVYMKWHVWDAIRALTKFNWCTSLSLHVGLYSSVTLLRNCSLKQLELIVVTHFSNEDSHISWLFMIVWLSQEIAKIPPLLNEIVHFKPKRLYIYNVAHSKYSKYFHDRFLRLMNRVVQKTFNWYIKK